MKPVPMPYRQEFLCKLRFGILSLEPFIPVVVLTTIADILESVLHSLVLPEH